MTEMKSPIDDDRVIDVAVSDDPPEGALPGGSNDGGDDNKKKRRTPAETDAAILEHRGFLKTASGVFYEYDSGCSRWTRPANGAVVPFTLTGCWRLGNVG